MADKYPEWFDFIRVCERRIIGSSHIDYVASFGPRNILTPEKDASRMESKLAGVKEWLWGFMERNPLGAAAPSLPSQETIEEVARRISELWRSNFGSAEKCVLAVLSSDKVSAAEGEKRG